MGTGWDQDIGLLHLIQIVSVPSVVKLVWIDRTKTGEEKMKLWKVENWETRIRIDQGIFNHEGRKMTRRSGGKDEIGENRKSGNSESAFWV